MRFIDIVDTTVRDGEQTKGVSFKHEEKLVIVKRLLADVGVSRCEVASAKVSKEEQIALSAIMEWAKSAGFENAVEVLSFTDYNKSIDWLKPTGCRRINLLTKGSQKHCELQLKKTLDEHLVDVKKTVAYAQENGFACNVYLEDWSNGIKNSPDYVWKMLDCYAGLGFERIILPDTLGVLNPFETEDYIRETVRRYPKAEFEFHPHNDYGMAAANALAAVRAGISGLHVTVNGLGERTGNVDLAQAAVAINDHSDAACKVNEKKLKDISILVETFSGKRIARQYADSGQRCVYADGGDSMPMVTKGQFVCEQSDA